MRKRLIFAIFLMTSCASHAHIRAVLQFRALREKGDDAAVQAYVAPGAKIWFGQKEGEGSSLLGNSWRHWDEYFHSHSEFTQWESHGNEVTAVGREMNDYYRLLDWTPPPFRQTWWFDASGRISEVLYQPLGKSTHRLKEFEAWAREHHPDELSYLMPKGEIDPSGDRPERWRPILIEWRSAAGLPPVY